MLAVRGLEVYVYGREERLIQAARGDRVDGLEAASVLKKVKKGKRLQVWEEKEANYRRSKLGLASEWRFEEGDRKSDSCSIESKYKNKLS